MSDLGYKETNELLELCRKVLVLGTTRYYEVAYDEVVSVRGINGLRQYGGTRKRHALVDFLIARIARYDFVPRREMIRDLLRASSFSEYEKNVSSLLEQLEEKQMIDFESRDLDMVAYRLDWVMFEQDYHMYPTWTIAPPEESGMYAQILYPSKILRYFSYSTMTHECQWVNGDTPFALEPENTETFYLHISDPIKPPYSSE